MAVTAEALQYLGALIREDHEGVARHQERVNSQGWYEAGGADIGAAFYLAAVKRFRGRDLQEIVNWVAEVRGVLGERADEIDPKLAESLLRAAARGETELAQGIDPTTMAQLELILTYKLTSDRNLTDAEVESFLEEAASLSEKWAEAE